MKKTLFILALLAINLCAAIAQSEDAAIRKAIEDETRAFHTNPDRNVFLSYWNITDETVMTYSGGGNMSKITGAQMRDAVKNGTIPGVDNMTVTYENFTVRSSGNVAWASFVQIDTDKDGKKGPRLHEYRMLEKINGAWKIVCSSVHEMKE